MFTITGKSFKRKDKFYINLEVTNNGKKKLESSTGHGVFVRPKSVMVDDVTFSDPLFGRSEQLRSIMPGEIVKLKIQVDAKDLLDIDGEGEYTLSYGVVQEFKCWYTDKCDIVLRPSAPAVEKSIEVETPKFTTDLYKSSEQEEE